MLATCLRFSQSTPSRASRPSLPDSGEPSGKEKRFKTITADNGTEFHSHKLVEDATGVEFYFATPYHSWERGTGENTNGLIRQYPPKRTSMAHIDQWDLEAIAHKLNTRPRKRLGFRTPEACYARS